MKILVKKTILFYTEKYPIAKTQLLIWYNEFSKLDTLEEIHSILCIEHDYYFLNKIEEINVVLGQRQLENIITTLNMITNRNNYDKIDSMKKLHIQKSICWCEKHDISCVKLYSSSNIFFVMYLFSIIRFLLIILSNFPFDILIYIIF
jgi:mRNA interferase HigB